MKPINPKSALLLPFVLSFGSMIIAISIYVYYKKVSSVATINYIILALIAIVSVVFFVGGCTKTIKYANQINIKKHGKLCKITYLSNECKVFDKSCSYYCITFECDDSQKIISRNEFEWNEVLAIKCAKEIDVWLYKSKAVLNTDLQLLKRQYASEMHLQQRVYDKAYDKLEELSNSESVGQYHRKTNSTDELKRKKITDNQSKPSAKDDK